MSKHIDVFDDGKGYVRLIDYMGDDLSSINSARASYEKESEEFTEKDARLLKFLYNNEHYSVFRHSVVSFEVRAPLMVCRQWYKYAIGSNHGEHMMGWNESSRRYVTSEPEFYIVNWRSKPESSKQGSGDFVDEALSREATDRYMANVERNLSDYEWAMKSGIAPEQARCFLNAYGMYVSWRWTASLQAVMFFLQQRLEDDAQYEIREYAKAVRDLVVPLFPYSFEAFINGN